MIYTVRQVSFAKSSCLFDMKVVFLERVCVCTSLDVFNSVKVSWSASVVKYISNASMNNDITSNILWICKYCYVLSNLSKIVLNDKKNASRSALFNKMFDFMIVTWIFDLMCTIDTSVKLQLINPLPILILILNDLNSKNNDPIEHSQFNQHISSRNHQNAIIITMSLNDLLYKSLFAQVFQLYSIYVSAVAIIHIVFVVSEFASLDVEGNSKNVSSSNCSARNDLKLGRIENLCKKYSNMVINDPVKLDLIEYKSIGQIKHNLMLQLYILKKVHHILY